MGQAGTSAERTRAWAKRGEADANVLVRTVHRGARRVNDRGPASARRVAPAPGLTVIRAGTLIDGISAIAKTNQLLFTNGDRMPT